MRVLGVCSYPIESAATRYRLVQFVEPLAQEGINLEISPFLDSNSFQKLYVSNSPIGKAFGLWSPFLRRFSESFQMGNYDLLFVQREAMFFGPAFFEWIFQKIGNVPLILDLDDATYLSYVSPTYGRFGSFFKFFGKTNKMIKRADAVICGNRFIAEYVTGKGAKAFVIPTVVDTEKYFPGQKTNAIPVIGWIGTHSTFPFLESIFPVLEELGKKYEFVLKIVGAGRESIKLSGVKIENLKWSLEREIADFQSLDIGLYPITTSASASDQWVLGKSGFKAIQYLAVGVPYVVTPIGVCAEIGIDGKTHFSASSKEQWYDALEKLLKSPKLREDFGKGGREYALENFTVKQQTDKIAGVFHRMLENSGKKNKLRH